MKTLTLKVDDSVNERLMWLLEHFPPSEIKILEQSEYMSDDDFLRSMDGMVESICEARSEPVEKGVKLHELEW